MITRTVDLGEIPKEWRIAWCPTCFSSLVWTREVLDELGSVWARELSWAIDHAEHDLILHHVTKFAAKEVTNDSRPISPPAESGG